MALSDEVANRQSAVARTSTLATADWRLLSITLLIAALTLTVAVLRDAILPGDVRFTRWVQGFDLAAADAVARFGNAVGSTIGIITVAAVLALLLWRMGHPGPALIIAATMLVRGLNPLLKAIIDSPRPAADLVRVSVESRSSGFPSGHAMSVAILYGAVVYLAPHVVSARRWSRVIQATALLLILTTGFARVYVGAHWPSQVLGGYLWGAFVLFALLTIGVRLRTSGDRKRQTDA